MDTVEIKQTEIRLQQLKLFSLYENKSTFDSVAPWMVDKKGIELVYTR